MTGIAGRLAASDIRYCLTENRPSICTPAIRVAPTHKAATAFTTTSMRPSDLVSTPDPTWPAVNAGPSGEGALRRPLLPTGSHAGPAWKPCRAPSGPRPSTHSLQKPQTRPNWPPQARPLLGGEAHATACVLPRLPGAGATLLGPGQGLRRGGKGA